MSSLGTMIVWPGDEGSIDEYSCKANFQALRLVAPGYRTWNDVVLVPIMKWIIQHVAEHWEAHCVCKHAAIHVSHMALYTHIKLIIVHMRRWTSLTRRPVGMPGP